MRPPCPGGQCYAKLDGRLLCGPCGPSLTNEFSLVMSNEFGLVMSNAFSLEMSNAFNEEWVMSLVQ